MNVLIELMLEFVEAGIGPSTDRGLVVTVTLASSVLVSVVASLSMTSADPLNESEWALAVYAGSMMVGAGGVLVSLLHFSRRPDDRVLALVCMVINLSAFAIPAAWLIG